MKATGIVRRIDELGRVVIPKEIRRTLRIREGDPLEIFTDRDGEVILKKYSPIGEMGDFAKEYAESLYRSLGHVVCICDKDNIIAVSGGNKKEYLDKPISEDIERIMKDRKAAIINRRDGGKTIPITSDEDEDAGYQAQVIIPIIAEGELIGAVALLTKQPNLSMGDTEIKVAETAARFLGRQMEQ